MNASQPIDKIDKRWLKGWRIPYTGRLFLNASLYTIDIETHYVEKAETTHILKISFDGLNFTRGETRLLFITTRVSTVTWPNILYQDVI